MKDRSEDMRKSLATLRDDLHQSWVQLDSLPYLYASNDLKADPRGCSIVGRFDFQEVMGYVKACHPSNILALLDELEASRQRIAELEKQLGITRNNALEEAACVAADAAALKDWSAMRIADDILCLKRQKPGVLKSSRSRAAKQRKARATAG